MNHKRGCQWLLFVLAMLALSSGFMQQTINMYMTQTNTAMQYIVKLFALHTNRIGSSLSFGYFVMDESAVSFTVIGTFVVPNCDSRRHNV